MNSAPENVLIPMFPRQNKDNMQDLVEARNLIESEIAAKVAAQNISPLSIILYLSNFFCVI